MNGGGSNNLTCERHVWEGMSEVVGKREIEGESKGRRKKIKRSVNRKRKRKKEGVSTHRLHN